VKLTLTAIIIGFVAFAAAPGCTPSVEDRAAEARELLKKGRPYEAAERLRALTAAASIAAPARVGPCTRAEVAAPYPSSTTARAAASIAPWT